MKPCCAVVANPAGRVPGGFSGARVQPAHRAAGRRGPLMAPPRGRSRGRMLLLAALVAAWMAAVVAVWWRAPAPARPAPPARATEPPPLAASRSASDAQPAAPAPALDGQGMQPRTPGTGR